MSNLISPRKKTHDLDTGGWPLSVNFKSKSVLHTKRDLENFAKLLKTKQLIEISILIKKINLRFTAVSPFKKKSAHSSLWFVIDRFEPMSR